MATAGPPSTSSFLPLLESLEDSTTGQSEQTDAYLTIANRLSGEEGRQFLPAVEKHFSRLGKAHVNSPNAELSQAALQALGFCVYHSHVVSEVPAETLSALCSLVLKSTDKNTCTRALWVISKQSFPSHVPSILAALESVWSREDIQSVVMEHEALNVVIRMLEQVPTQMCEGAVQWAKLVIPLVIHSASKVRLRAAAAMEMGMPLLLEKQTEVAAVIEPMMSSKLIPELQKLFMSKNEANVLKLWPLFVKLLGKLLHRGGPFINSLLHLEELGFRSSSATIKKIAFIAWKSLIDNFALNPDILCSAKRMKLLMQPLTSIHVRTEALMLTKVEVWWYLVVQLGPNLSSNFDQVRYSPATVTLVEISTFFPNAAGAPSFNSPANTSRMSLSSSMQVPSTFPSIQLLALEMLLHYFLGPEAAAVAAKNKLILSLGEKPLKHPLLSGASSFTKHAVVLTSSIRDGFINIGKEAPGSKKDRQGCEVLTLMLQALQSIVTSEALPAARVLTLFEATVKVIPHRVLGSASYQVGKMDVLNGTPALFLILLLYNSSMLPAYIEDERFFQCLQKLVGCGLSGPTSPLAFAEAVLGAIRNSAGSLQNKEQLWRMWSVVVSTLTDTITQSNEVNQGDALEHNFSAMHSALLFPVTHLIYGTSLPFNPKSSSLVTQKSMLSAWSKLYKVFARCSALVVTAEENICCEEFCAKMAASIDKDALKVPSTLNAVANILQVMVESVDFSPYTSQFQQKLKSPHTPVNWMRKRNKALGNLSTFQSLLVQCLEVYLEGPEGSSEATGTSLVSILSALFTNLALANAVQEALTSLIQPLTQFYRQFTGSKCFLFSTFLLQLEKLVSEIFGCLQSRSTFAYNDDLLALLSPLLCVLFPHKSKHIRTSVTHFWNSTFSNSVSLDYPDEIRPILSQVKQKTPIILPGFEVVTVSDELSGPYSSESSQLETKLSGMPVSSVGKRDSLLGKTAELKDWASPKTSKPVSTKLDFGSPKPPRREVLEEEASIDFVFIPPETKERVLTEHQKEVKRTKRVDIPAMYNNLDASLDSTVFTQYTQSQEDSSPKATETVAEKPHQEEVIPESTDVSMEDDAKNDEKAEGVDMKSEERTSPNISSSSDLVSGTPQKPNSRRQSFITLEKYAEGKPASPSSATRFTGPLVKTSSSQQHYNTNNTPSTLDSKTSTEPNSQDSQSTDAGKSNSQHPVNDTPESPRRPKDSVLKSEPVRLIDRMPSDTTEDEDVIPDTQSEVERKEATKMSSTSEEMKPLSQEEESDQSLDDSQSSLNHTSPGEPRRSGRHRVRPLLPGEDPEERDEKYTQFKRRRSGLEPKSDSPAQSRPNTRSKQAAEEDSGRERLRSRAQRDKSESSQTNSESRSHKKMKLYRSSDNFLDKHQPKRRSTREHESSQTDSQSDYESQSQGRRRRQSKTSMEIKEDGRLKEKVSPEKESSQTSTCGIELLDQIEKDHQLKKDTQIPTPGDESQEVDHVEQTKKDDQPQDDSQILTSLQTDVKSQESEVLEETKAEKRDAQLLTSSPAHEESQDGTSTTNKSDNEELVKDKHKTTKVMVDGLSQEDSPGVSPSSSDSQSVRRSRRSKASSETEESEDKSDGRKDSLGRQSRSNSQTPVPAVGEPDSRIGGRTRRSKVQEELSKSSPGSTPEGSQSQDSTGSESSQGRGRYSRRRSLVANVETSESESSEARESSPMPRKRGRKPRASLPSPLTIESTDKINIDAAKDNTDHSQRTNTQSFEAKDSDVGDSLKSQNLHGSELLQLAGNIEEQSNDETPMEVGVDASVPVAPEIMETGDITANEDTKEQKEKDCQTNVDNTSSQESGDKEDVFESNEASDEQVPDKLPCDTPVVSAVDAPVSTDEMSEKLPISEPSEKAEDVPKTEEDQKDDSDHPEHAVFPVENTVQDSENQVESPHVEDNLSKDEELSASKQHTEASGEEEITSLQEKDEDGKSHILECQEEEEAKSDNMASMSSESTHKDVFQDSPAKQKDLEGVLGPDVAQSPISGRTRGTWSPSASPSTSILKKGQKRPLEEEIPSPLVKSRRVSFADPIQQQETADDIDRRSPAIRTSSPRRSKISLPQPKFVTTPTKGLLILSPRNLHSPGYKSSKKCLISEMSQEPRPVSRDCIYPALVGCSTPVEAVLPQISSNMWSRGFGQLVRARNIKTVGDLSALTPTEIKTLPIRSPKISNVKKALKIYEQQRKGRGGDELKSFDETEMMTSEPEEISAPQNQDDEDKTSELVDDPAPADGKQDDGGYSHETPETHATEKEPAGPLHPDGLLSEVEALTCRMTPLELSHCSPKQLVQLHDQLGGMMSRVVVELQTRLCHTDGKP
uniref:Telomere-associated protein Rif1 N-terminal domain-containing protein n=1 Tax=Anabas testudineus TaxID=64144 RepID=A0A3Q1JEE4_ANATE